MDILDKAQFFQCIYEQIARITPLLRAATVVSAGISFKTPENLSYEDGMWVANKIMELGWTFELHQSILPTQNGPNLYIVIFPFG